MQNFLLSSSRYRPLCLTWLMLLLILLAACSPKFNWREVHGSSPPFTVLLPAKPASVTRPIDLNGIAVEMIMTAAEVDGVTFAIGAVSLADANGAAAALAAMKTGLLRNINASIDHAADNSADPLTLEATGKPTPEATELLLLARFVANGPHVYQVLVLGPANKLNRDEAENFFSSFKPN